MRRTPIVPLPGRDDVLVDGEIARLTAGLLFRLAGELHRAGVSVPDGTWEVARDWRDGLTGRPPPPPAGSANGSAPGTAELTGGDGQARSTHEHIDATTAADILGCSREYIGRLARNGDLPGHQPGGPGRPWVFDRPDVERHAATMREART